jgi:prepilin-type processing-associated H-X9-DG protein
MSTPVTCFCGTTFPALDDLAGGYTHCPACGAVVYVPWPLPATQEQEAVRTRRPLRTLVKVLLVVAGLAFLGVLLMPDTSHCGPPMRRAQCMNNLKQIALAMQIYHDKYNAFPPQAVTEAHGKPLLSWRVLLLPFIEEDALYSRFKLDEPWDSPTNLPLLALMPTVYSCPSNLTLPPGMTCYEGVVGPHTMFRDDRRGVRIAEVTDGTSNTLFFGEAQSPVPWSAPQDIPFDSPQPYHGFGSPHPGGFNTAFVDGSIRFISLRVNPAVLNSLLTRDGGEVGCTDSYEP